MKNEINKPRNKSRESQLHRRKTKKFRRRDVVVILAAGTGALYYLKDVRKPLQKSPASTPLKRRQQPQQQRQTQRNQALFPTDYASFAQSRSYSALM